MASGIGGGLMLCAGVCQLPFGGRFAKLASGECPGIDFHTAADGDQPLTPAHKPVVRQRRDVAGNVEFFEIAGQDGKYFAADAWIEGETVVVQCKEIAKPVYVRYLFRKPEPDPEVSLLNAEGLPASSFLTDDFKPVRIAPKAKISKPKTAKNPMTDEEKKKNRQKKREARKKASDK